MVKSKYKEVCAVQFNNPRKGSIICRLWKVIDDLNLNEHTHKFFYDLITEIQTATDAQQLKVLVDRAENELAAFQSLVEPLRKSTAYAVQAVI